MLFKFYICIKCAKLEFDNKTSFVLNGFTCNEYIVIQHVNWYFVQFFIINHSGTFVCYAGFVRVRQGILQIKPNLV